MVGLYFCTKCSSIDCYSVQGVHGGVGDSKGMWLLETFIQMCNGAHFVQNEVCDGSRQIEGLVSGITQFH